MTEPNIEQHIATGLPALKLRIVQSSGDFVTREVELQAVGTTDKAALKLMKELLAMEKQLK